MFEKHEPNSGRYSAERSQAATSQESTAETREQSDSTATAQPHRKFPSKKSRRSRCKISRHEDFSWIIQQLISENRARDNAMIPYKLVAFFFLLQVKFRGSGTCDIQRLNSAFTLLVLPPPPSLPPPPHFPMSWLANFFLLSLQSLHLLDPWFCQLSLLLIMEKKYG